MGNLHLKVSVTGNNLGVAGILIIFLPKETRFCENGPRSNSEFQFHKSFGLKKMDQFFDSKGLSEEWKTLKDQISQETAGWVTHANHESCKCDSWKTVSYFLMAMFSGQRNEESTLTHMEKRDRVDDLRPILLALEEYILRNVYPEINKIFKDRGMRLKNSLDNRDKYEITWGHLKEEYEASSISC